MPHMHDQTQRGPLSRYERFRTCDLEEACSRVAQIYCPHELRIVNRDVRRVDTCMSHVSFGGVSINRLRYGPTVHIDAGCLNRFFLVMMPITGNAEVCCGDKRVASSRSVAVVVSPTEPLYQTIHAQTDQIMIQVDRELLERTCAQHVGHGLRHPVCFRADLAMHEAGASWSALVSYLLAELDREAPHLDSPLVRGQLEHLAMATLLYSQPNNYSEELKKPARPIAPAHVKRVEAYIEANAEQPLTVARLAAHAGVSTSALYAGFREFRNASPMAYLRSVRLKRARDTLLEATPATTTVTDVAMRWGFRHLGRFTSHYKKHFGELPCNTLRKS